MLDRPAEIPGPVSRTATLNVSVGRGCLDQHLARVGELDCISDQIEQDLGEAMLVAMTGREIGRHLDLELQPLLHGQRLDRAVDRVHHVA